MKELEIEKTFLAKHIPSDLNNTSYSSIEDYYLPVMDGKNRIRIRKQDDLIEFTKKSPAEKWNHAINNEETILLTEKEFENFSYIPCQKIIKKRYNYFYDKVRYEVDIFEWDLEGLVMIDVEFSNRDELENFKAPKFCLCDVTQDAEIAWNKLIWKTFKDLEKFFESKGYSRLKLD